MAEDLHRVTLSHLLRIFLSIVIVHGHYGTFYGICSVAFHFSRSPRSSNRGTKNRKRRWRKGRWQFKRARHGADVVPVERAAGNERDAR